MSKEVTVAVISAVSAIAVALIGGYFLLQSQQPHDNSSTRTKEGPSKVNVAIRAELLPDQISVSLDVEIDGESEGSLFMEDKVTPEDHISVSLAPNESHHYEIQGYQWAPSPLDGSPQKNPVAGEDNIYVSDGENQTFRVEAQQWDGDTLLVSLE
jgi:hypothetical protein